MALTDKDLDELRAYWNRKCEHGRPVSRYCEDCDPLAHTRPLTDEQRYEMRHG